MANKVQGAADTHRIITPKCRRRPKAGVKEEVLRDVEESIDALLDVYGEGHDVNIHVAVTVERE